jgi:two-component system sensor histidine kinase AlgZ
VNPRPDHFVIPDLCNTSGLALLILFSQLLVVVLLFAGDVSWVRLGLMSMFIQSIALVSAGIMCLSRGWILRLNLVMGATFALVIVLVVTLLIGLATEQVVDRGPGMPERWAGQMVIAGIISGLVLRYFYVQQRLHQQEQAELKSRIQALQSRIRPHFLFNSMNIIASLIAVDPETAETVVEDLSELFRASLNETGNQVPIEDELSLCKHYLRIEGLRLGERLQLDWDIAEHKERVMIPMLTLQPLLENAIYHGIQPLPEGGTISVRLTYEPEVVVIRVENPVPNRDYACETEGNKMAIPNIRSRLNVLYGSTAELTTESRDDIFITNLVFPINPQSV